MPWRLARQILPYLCAGVMRVTWQHGSRDIVWANKITSADRFSHFANICITASAKYFLRFW
jgi:hypothetical protein